jgi:hypothetical protein
MKTGHNLQSLYKAALLALVSASALAQDSLTNGLVGYYPFHGDANDYSGHGHDALASGAAFAADRFGQTNSALDLRGPSNFIEIPYDADFRIGTNNFTYSLWLKYGPQSGNGTGYSGVLEMNGFYFLVDYPTAGHVSYYFGGVGYTFSSASGLTDNMWRHFALVRTGTTMSLYIDGLLDSTNSTGSLVNFANADPIWIGCNLDSPEQQNYDGLVDDARIYNRALSIQELFALSGTVVIVHQPKSFIGLEGSTGSFSVIIDGQPPFYYQWYKDGSTLTGETNSTLTFPQINFTNEGTYTVVVTNASFQLTSAPATLVVNPAGVSVALYAGTTLQGILGRTYAIQYTTDISNTNSWYTATNIVLQTSPQLWVDTSVPAQTGSQARRFYRVKVVVP